MFYYLVDKIGDGTRLNPFRPDLPNDTSFVGVPSDYSEVYLIATNVELSEVEQKILPMQMEEIAKITGWLKYKDILSWFVGDG
jgi:hypothetical protein